MPPIDLTRRQFLGGALASGCALHFAAHVRGGDPEDPVSLPSFDQAMEAHMRPREIPGGALAVLHHGRLVHARGYGLLDRDGTKSVDATSLFRIASVSKPITAIAILRLLEADRLQLEDPILKFLDVEPHLTGERVLDPRWEQVTIRHALQHSGGWDRDRSFDPMFRAVPFALELNQAPPASARDVIRVMRGLPLDFDPGTRYAYSNFGYCLLGRVIEHIAKQPYDQFVREAVLQPIGARTMQIGRSLPADRAPNETRYHLPPGESKASSKSVFASVPGEVPSPDGGFHLEAMDAHGGWIASAVDLARVLSALDAPTDPPLLRASSMELMFAHPDAPLWTKEDGAPENPCYGLGWMVREVGADADPKSPTRRINTWHAGSLPGTRTLMVRRHDGLSWVALFNQRQDLKEFPDGAIDGALHRAAAAVKEWPTHDLFSQYAR